MSEATAARTITEGVARCVAPDALTLVKPQTDYAVRLLTEEPTGAAEGAKLRGEIRVLAARIDVIRTGGRFIEPVEGPPQRIAGRIVEIEERANRLAVDAGPFVVVCKPNQHQQAKQFRVDQMVTMGVRPGATFKPV